MANEFRFPDLGTNLVEGEVTEWLVQVGEPVAIDQPLVEVETGKSVTEIPSPFEGVVLHHGVAAGERIRVGELLVVIGEPGETWTPSDDGAAPEPDAPAVRATPVVRRLAQERGIDLATVTGSGPDGTIVRADVEAAAVRGAAGSEGPHGERRPLTGVRRAAAERLVRSWREIPHFHTHDVLDATALLDAKARLGDARGRPVPLEAVAIACLLPILKEFPEFNAAVEGDELVLWSRYDVGFAVDTPEGLALAVVRDADQLDLDALSERIEDLAGRARERRLAPAEATGATFTVSNVGALSEGGTTAGTPLIPLGTSAILSLGRAAPQPYVRDGEIVIAPVMPLDLGCDHRVIDGRLNRQFVHRLKQHLSAPTVLLNGLSQGMEGT